MRLIIILTFLILSNFISAQKHNEAYEDLSLGWMKIYNYKGASKTLQIDEKKYSIAQLSIIDSFANWMQASYWPKGSLGDIKKYVTPKKNDYHERYNEAVPPSYGASTYSYTFLRQTNGKWQPYLNFANYWNIAANEIPLTYRQIDFNTSKTCLFMLPLYDEKSLADDPNSLDAKTKKLFDLSSHPLLKKYIYYNLKAYNKDFGNNLVILSKNNKFPFLPVTIGEALQFAEEAFPVKYAEEKKTAYEQNSYDATHLKSAMQNLDGKFSNARATILTLREKYKNRLNEQAYMKYGGYSIQSLSNGSDIFENGNIRQWGSFDKSYPLFRVDPEIQAKCSSDKPQWILIKWYGGLMADPVFKHMHESIINNFDFDYVYNFFFEPEKIKGVTYKPLRSPKTDEKTITIEKSDNAKKMESNGNIFFFEDFSTTIAGQKPNGWKSEMNSDAKYATVVNARDNNEKWLEIKGNNLVIPLNIKMPLPQNFEFSFDAAVPKDIAWGAKALELYLGTKGKYDENLPSLKIRLRAGFYGRAGEGSITGNFGAGYFNSYQNFEATGFSNDKEFNMVKIMLKKNGESLDFYIDKNKIVSLPKAYTSVTMFNWIQFRHLNSDADNQKYYITNIKITKE